MAGTLLQNVVAFTGLVVGAPSIQPHGLNLNGAAVIPKVIAASVGGFTVTADATNITVTRTVSAAGNSVNVYAQFWFAMALDAFSPFIVDGDVGAGPSPSGRQSFKYVATGAELASGFDINFPSARPDTNYLASVTGGPLSDPLSVMSFTVEAKTLTKITVVPSSKPVAGDIYDVNVEQYTS
jgi:hypothetical protein